MMIPLPRILQLLLLVVVAVAVAAAESSEHHQAHVGSIQHPAPLWNLNGSHSAASQNLPSTTSVAINVTKLDCGMRQLALEHAKKLLKKDTETRQHVFDALRLEDLCHVDRTTATASVTANDKENVQVVWENHHCRPPNYCIYVVSSLDAETDASSWNAPWSPDLGSSLPTRRRLNHAQSKRRVFQADGTKQRPFSSIHDAIQFARGMGRNGTTTTSSASALFHRKVILGPGIHSLDGKTLQLSKEDNGLSIVGYPSMSAADGSKNEPSAWLSGGIPLQNVVFEPQSDASGIYVANLTALLKGRGLPHILSLFTTNRRWIRARYPNADPETDQWGYASPNRLKYSLDARLVLEWHLPPKGPIPNFTFVDFQVSPPDGVPQKNDSTQRGYNWYASGKGGVCSDVWGVEADSYWCSNASQGGWAEVDQECATTGQIQLPIGLTYNITSEQLGRFQNAHLQGGILHSWHSQSWAMHMFEITQHMPKTGVIQLAKGGGRQGGRNWCRCDQCTYAAGWCGQHQTPAWHDTRLISGTWMIENVKEELDQVGEYYFDRGTNLLYVKPNSTADLVDFRVGLLEQILDLKDGSGITIENVGFRDTAPTYHPRSDWSAPSGGDWSLHRGGAIFLEHVSNVTIRNCQFRRLDGNAIFLSRRTRNVTIEDNRFEWLGENAIATWGETDGYDATAENFPMYTMIRGNVMRELGIFEKQSSAVGQSKAAFTYIIDNIMFNMPRAAINFNDMVGGGDVIKGNLIFNTCRESGDHGPINSWDRQPFLTTLRDGKTKSFDPVPREIVQNFIIANYGASQGVDNDDGSSWFHIHHNLFYSAEGFKMDYGGHDSVFEDNLIMAFPYDGSQCFNMGDFYNGHGDILRRNRCLVGLGHKMGSGCGDPSCANPIPETDESQQIVGHLWGGCDNSTVELSDNQYFTPDGEAQIECQDDTFTLEEVQTKFGMEKGSSKAKLPDEETMIDWAKEMMLVAKNL